MSIFSFPSLPQACQFHLALVQQRLSTVQQTLASGKKLPYDKLHAAMLKATKDIQIAIDYLELHKEQEEQ